MARTDKEASGEKAPVYEVLAHDIKAMGIEAVFGLMSDDTASLRPRSTPPAPASSARVTRTQQSPWPTAMPMPQVASALQ